MASNDDNSRRNGRRPEDNPFVAFRRFADSQVSSLFDTVFSLPATLARFNDAEHAREQCLFGQADKKKCEELQKLTDEMTQQAYKSVGDLPQLLQSRDSEALKARLADFTKLEQEIDKVTQEIVEAGRGQERAHHASSRQADNVEMIEKVGNRKGQQWGWSWDWGFPRPFDEEERSKLEEKTDWGRHGAFHDSHYSQSRSCRRWQRWRERRAAQQAKDDEKPFDGGEDNVSSRSEQLRRSIVGEDDHDYTASDAAAWAMFEQISKQLWSESHNARANPYSPKSLEEDEFFSKAGISWRDAWEDLVRTTGGRELIAEEKLGESKRLPHERWEERIPEAYPFRSIAGFFGAPWADPWTGRIGSDGTDGETSKNSSWSDFVSEFKDEPSYEYGHDHEDQHDDPPTPKPKQGAWSTGTPSTELEAYEKLLGTTSGEPVATGRPSVLSTLTTTERSVAPDGTVTTKVVLKKRFADGREESSETVHTQKGQEDAKALQQDPWKAMQDAQFSSQESSAPRKKEEKKDDKKRGWFWTG